MIKIKSSKTADSRTCNRKEITLQTLKDSTQQHISDVRKGLGWVILQLLNARTNHDHTKLDNIKLFHKDFVNQFNPDSEFLKIHYTSERHHLFEPTGVKQDVDLIDVLQCLIDGVMAGMGRRGEYSYQQFPQGLLQNACRNTVNKLLKQIVVK